MDINIVNVFLNAWNGNKGGKIAFFGVFLTLS